MLEEIVLVCELVGTLSSSHVGHHMISGTHSSPVIKSCMAAISGSPLRGVTRFSLVCKHKNYMMWLYILSYDETSFNRITDVMQSQQLKVTILFQSSMIQEKIKVNQF